MFKYSHNSPESVVFYSWTVLFHDLHFFIAATVVILLPLVCLLLW